MENFTQKFDSYSTAEDIMRDVDIEGKTYLVTGSTTGLGYYSSLSLLKNGANVIITARSVEKAETTLTKLKTDSGSASIRFLVMDQTCLSEVKRAAEEFLSWNVPLNGIMLNAAVFGGGHQSTKQGHELHFGVNHLSHYLLAELLKEKLIESAPSRIVILSSESHRQPKVTGIKYEELSVDPQYYWSMLQYNRSKFCNMLHMCYLNSKISNKGVNVYAVHPGNLVPTGIDRQWWFWKLLFLIARPLTKTITQGAATQLYCLTHPDVSDISGSYWNQCCPCAQLPSSNSLPLAIELNTLSRNLVKDFLNDSM